MAYALAERLGMRIHEVLSMTAEEFLGWWAYFKVKQQQK